MNSEHIVTDSFHGTCISLIINKPFTSIKNRNKLRFDTLQKIFSNCECIYNSMFDSAIEAINSLGCKTKNYFDFNNVNTIINKKKEYETRILNDVFDKKYQLSYSNINAYLNIDFANAVKNIYDLRSKFNDAQEFISLCYNITKNINYMPSFLVWDVPNINSYYMQMLINGVPRKIHYEFLVAKNIKYFCLHCEDVNFKEFCNDIFLNIQKLWNINSNNHLKINVPISNSRIVDDIIDLLKVSIPEVSRLIKRFSKS